MNRRNTVSILASLALLFGGAGSAQAAPDGPERQQTLDLLERAESALAGYATRVMSSGSGIEPVRGRELSAVLHELRLGLRSLRPAERRRAERVFERPSNGGDQDSFGKEAAASPVCDPNICVHWGSGKSAPDAEDLDLNGLPDYIDEVYAAAAKSVEVENGTLGWRAPVSDGKKGSRNGRGGEGQVDLYVAELGQQVFGYATSDSGSFGRRISGYLVIDNDYAGFGGAPLDLMRATVAHEYNHILQYGYNALMRDGWIYESTATWIENEVFPEVDDYLNFVRVFARSPHKPLAETNSRAVKLYGSAVWNQFLAGRFGPGLIEQVWAGSNRSRPRDIAVGAYERALAAAGGPDFAQQFAAFAAETAEWNSSSSFPDAGRYMEMKRSGAIGSRTQKGKLDHTAYRLFNVPGRGDVKLVAKLSRGTRWAIALVGRTDGEPVIRTVFKRGGGRAAISLDGIQSYGRVTALVINADPRSSARPKYRHDGEKYKVRLIRG